MSKGAYQGHIFAVLFAVFNTVATFGTDSTDGIYLGYVGNVESIVEDLVEHILNNPFD